MSVVIDAEFRNLTPPLQRQERSGLEARLRSEGCRDALVVWRNGKDILLDGHNRYEICATYGIPFRVAPIELESREHARLWIEENQLGRRNLTDDQRAMIAQAVMERRSALTRSSQLARAREIKAGASVEDNVTSTGPKLRTRAAVAKDAKLAERNLRAAAELKRAAPFW